jgi:hypothetical protein
MSKVKTSGYARFIDDELEFGGVGYYSKLSKNKTKEHKGAPDGKSKSKKRNYDEQRKLKRGE